MLSHNEVAPCAFPTEQYARAPRFAVTHPPPGSSDRPQARALQLHDRPPYIYAWCSTSTNAEMAMDGFSSKVAPFKVERVFQKYHSFDRSLQTLGEFNNESDAKQCQAERLDLHMRDARHQGYGRIRC